ncbi:MAG: hypothetical protein H6942_09465 [Candidatus Accumulibacter sp.]|uniref:CbiQ family ECF transporter T component n=1 Tax=Accumulibacter sp. TaxID=2053492 RepID=UPI0025D8E77A|nr:CbiQ family ECF transporter T component [Accumulibacter sp.]MCP5248741.1 hypothetical protein [Accumulibacter sp.]
MHPTTYLVIWLSMLVASQFLDGYALLTALLLLPLSGAAVRRRWRRLAWAMRWLLLSLFVVLAWGSAGDPAWSGAMAPTREGLVEASTHLGRLLLALMAVAVLLEWLPVPDLLAATHRLLAPLRRCGIDPDRSVVRLLLVLRYIETTPRPRDWRSLLDVPASDRSECLELVDRRFSWLDLIAIGVVIGGGVTIYCLRQA